MTKIITKLLLNYNFTPFLSNITSNILGVLFCFVSYYLMYFLVKLIEKNIFKKIISKTKNKIDDALYETKVIQGVVYFIPLLCLMIFEDAIFASSALHIFTKILNVIIQINFLFLIIQSLDFLCLVLNSYKISKNIPIKSIVQVLKVILFILILVSIIAKINNKEIGGILAGFGAIAAAITFVFKDFIMGFVSSIYLSFNKSLSIGDWIEIPSESVDGEIVEISMQSVKVLNWDKSLAIVPTYSLILKNYLNWKVMESTNSRRITANFNIDMDSIKNIDNSYFKDLSEKVYYPKYLEEEEKDYKTNFSAFKSYIDKYLANNDKIKSDSVFMSRVLDPNHLGMPYQIYCFTDIIDWKKYEEIKTELTIFLINEAKKFEIKIYQKSSLNM